MKKTICFVSHSNPNELCGVSLYYKHLLNELKEHKELDITWAYFGKEDKLYSKDGLNYIEIKKSRFKLPYFENNFKVKRFLNNNKFNIVFTTGGPWTYFYNKPKFQKLFHIYHGTVFYFNLNHLKRFNLFQKIVISPLLALSWISERPHKDVNKIICVSNKVKDQVEKLYKKRNIKVIRTGVNLKEFKQRDINKKHLVGLYIGGGNWYTKGLDRAIDLSKEIYKIDKNYSLIVIGPNKNSKKVRELIDNPFVKFVEDVPRKKIKYYYNKCNFFLMMSRYEGGAPTLTTSEAMASGCLIICSKDSQQEIIKDNLNGLIISSFNKKNAKNIMDNIKNKSLIKNSLKTIKNLSLTKWSKRFYKVVTD